MAAGCDIAEFALNRHTADASLMVCIMGWLNEMMASWYAASAVQWPIGSVSKSKCCWTHFAVSACFAAGRSTAHASRNAGRNATKQHAK